MFPNPNPVNQPNLSNPQNNQNQIIQEQEKRNLAIKINSNLKSFDKINPNGLIKENAKNGLGLNFKIFGNTYSRNSQISAPEKIYFLSHNLRSDFEKRKKEQINVEDFSAKYSLPKFEQISNNVLNREKDFYKEFIELNGNIEINDLNVVNNISSELRKINANSPFNYMQENPTFDFNNNKLGIYLLLQQNGNYGKIFDNNKKNKISSSYKRCNEHRRRRVIQKKIIKLKSQNKIDIISARKSSSNLKDDQSMMSNISSLRKRKNYLNEEENNLFDKYFNSFIPYFKELIINKKLNINDKTLKLREVINININNFKEGRRNFCELIKTIITPLNNNENANRLTTKNLIGRIIKYLENDFERKNYLPSQNFNFKKKDEFITNYANNKIYTYFSNIISHSQSQTIILWAKLYYYIRFGWKKECIAFIKSIEGLNLRESGLKEVKECLDDEKEIYLNNYNELKRIINQERKEENPFKHACIIYITKIPEQLYNNILLEINDHLWFNLNLIYPDEKYKNLIKKANGKEEDENILEINTSSNQNKSQGIIELVNLKDLQSFFGNISIQDLLNLNNKNTNFTYIILLVGLLKFKTALSFMIKNNMYVDAINFYFILKQLGIYSDFNEINDTFINIPQKKYIGVQKYELEEIYQIYPRASNNISALILYSIYSDKNNFIRPLAYLLVETEAFDILNNYENGMQLFANNNNDNNNNINNNNDLSIKSFNVCLHDLIDKKTLIDICKVIFELLSKHEMRNKSNLNHLLNVFKDLKMLTELTGLLINQSIEILNLKKPIIYYGNNGKFSINLRDNKNIHMLEYSLISNNFGGLINDIDKIFIEKQNEMQKLINENREGENSNRIFALEKEIGKNKFNIPLLKQLPIIENIYSFIYMGNFDGAFSLYMENIEIVKVGFESDEENYKNEIRFFLDEILKKMKYGLLGLYPDILYLFVWLFKIELIDFLNKGYNKLIVNLKDKAKALEFLLDELVKISRNDNNLMEYNDIFNKAKIEVNQIQQFYLQSNFI